MEEVSRISSLFLPPPEYGWFRDSQEKWAEFSIDWDEELANPLRLNYFKMSEAALSGEYSPLKEIGKPHGMRVYCDLQ
jgi:hypothetical protein